MRNKKPTITMSDVARDAGVGTMTVSRALRDPLKVSEKTRQTVLASVTKLGYVLDETAASLSSKRTRIVGAVVSTLDQSIFAETVRGLSERLQTNGQQLLVATSDYSKNKETELIRTIIGRKPEAMVLTSSEHSQSAEQLIELAKIPTVETWEIPERPICACVGFSNREASRSITKHLYDSGKKKIAFLGMDRADDTRGRLRSAGYLDVASEKHTGIIELQIPNIGYFGPDYGAMGLNAIMRQWPDTDAIVCASDAIAFGVYCEALRQGIRIPKDLAISGFGDFDYAKANGINLTTIHIDGEKIGHETADLINRSINGIEIKGKIVDVGFQVIRRQTS